MSKKLKRKKRISVKQRYLRKQQLENLKQSYLGLSKSFKRQRLVNDKKHQGHDTKDM